MARGMRAAIPTPAVSPAAVVTPAAARRIYSRRCASCSSVPESDREAEVAIARGDIAGQRDPAATPAPRVELQHPTLDPERGVESTGDTVEPVRLPVAAAGVTPAAGLTAGVGIAA